MIYEWKCTVCGTVNEVERPVAEYNLPPKKCKNCGHNGFKKLISKSSTPFQHLRQSGVFMDDNGNYAPRNT